MKTWTLLVTLAVVLVIGIAVGDGRGSDTLERQRDSLMAQAGHYRADSARWAVQDSARADSLASARVTRDSLARVARIRRGRADSLSRLLAQYASLVPRAFVDTLLAERDTLEAVLSQTIASQAISILSLEAAVAQRDTTIGQLHTLWHASTEQAESWRRKARPRLGFRLPVLGLSVRPSAACGLALSGGVGCVAGVGVAF